MMMAFSGVLSVDVSSNSDAAAAAAVDDNGTATTSAITNVRLDDATTDSSLVDRNSVMSVDVRRKRQSMASAVDSDGQQDADDVRTC